MIDYTIMCACERVSFSLSRSLEFDMQPSLFRWAHCCRHFRHHHQHHRLDERAHMHKFFYYVFIFFRSFPFFVVVAFCLYINFQMKFA